MFYDNFVKLSNSIGKSPSAVALECGLSKPTVTKWKQGGKPTATTVQKLADYFGVTTDYLLTGEQKETSKDISSATKFSKHEIQLIKQYRAKPEMQNAIDKLLGI